MKHSFHEMNFILVVICTLWLLSVAANAGNHKALLFNRVTRAVIDLPNNPRRNCEAWATACPAAESVNADQEFIEKYSITKKALFAKKTCNKEDSVSEVDLNICEKPFQLSVVHNLQNLSVEFGYEVFYERKREYEYYNCLYENYHTIERTSKVVKSIIKTGIFSVTNFVDRLKTRFIDNSGTLWYNTSYQMRLLWVPLFKLRFSFSKMILSTLTYEIRRNNKWPIADKCTDYNLGSEAYRGLDEDMDTLYTNQKKIFKHLKLPSKPCSPDALSCPLNRPCDSNNECLEKWSLIPLDQFHLFPTSPLLCSHMTTVPIWKDVAKAPLEKLDQYLYALFRVLKTPLHIISGIKGQLILSKKKITVPWSDTVYLDPVNQKIPAPKIIYKIVRYKLPKCKPKPNEKICKYSVIFVIHNDPNFKPNLEDRLCPVKGEDITMKWGWNAVTKGSDGNDCKNVYVCPNDEETLRKIYGRFSLDKPKTTIGNLDLTKFPVLKEDGTVGDEDIVADVDREFLDLLTNGDTDSDQDDVADVSQENFDEFEDTLSPKDLETTML